MSASEEAQDKSQRAVADKRRPRRRRPRQAQAERSAQGEGSAQRGASAQGEGSARGERSAQSEGSAQRRGSARGERSAQRRGSARGERSAQAPADKLKLALKLLSEVAQARAQDLGVPQLTPFMVDFEVGGDAQEQREQLKRLERQLTERASAQVPTQWRRGSLYCFETEQAISPPHPWSVFSGYDILGRPQWSTLLALCLEGDADELSEELSALSEEPPRPVALQRSGDLSEYILESVRAGRRYDVLAQLIIGPLSQRFTPVLPDEERYILSAQVILSQPDAQPLQLRLNLLGFDELQLFEGASRLPPRAPLAQARDALMRAQQQLRGLERLSQQGGLTHEELSKRAARLLSQLKGSLMRALNAGEGRTRHAQQRHEQMERPTSHAKRDALSAGDDRLFLDAHKDTLIALGPKGRAHVFSQRAEHVTSVRLGSGELERKLSQGRWRPLEPARVADFKARLRAQ